MKKINKTHQDEEEYGVVTVSSSSELSGFPNLITFPEELEGSFANSFILQVSEMLSGPYRTEPITILIGSGGGSLRAALSVRNYMATLRRAGIVFRTIVPAYAYSAGAFIAASGNKGHRFAFPTSEIMIHAVQGVILGDFYSDLKKGYSRLQEDMKFYLSILAFEISKDEENKVDQSLFEQNLEKIISMCQSNGTWMNEHQAKDLGIIDHIRVPILLNPETFKKTISQEGAFSHD